MTCYCQVTKSNSTQGSSSNTTVPVLTEKSCDATNKASNITVNSTNPNCKTRYQYLVAVIATTQNSSLLL